MSVMKVVLEIEKFHGKTPKSIRQELFAVVSDRPKTTMRLCRVGCAHRWVSMWAQPTLLLTVTFVFGRFLIMSVIARTLMMITARVHGPSKAEFQFKNAVMTLASEAAMLVPHDPATAVEIFSEILNAISRVRYYRSKAARPSQPRLTKRPRNKWCFGRREDLNDA